EGDARLRRVGRELADVALGERAVDLGEKFLDLGERRQPVLILELRGRVLFPKLLADAEELIERERLALGFVALRGCLAGCGEARGEDDHRGDSARAA